MQFTVLGVYLLIVNVIELVLMAVDKVKAVSNKRRISEACLFFFDVIGGSIGGLFGMYIFNHKTRHLKFMICFPLFALVHIVLCVIYFVYTH